VTPRAQKSLAEELEAVIERKSAEDGKATSKKQERRVVIGTTFVLATLGVWALWYARKRDTISGRTIGKRGGAKTKKLPKGSLSCPSEEGRVPPSLATLTVGDFVTVKLLDEKDKFVERTWGQVRAISPDRTLLKVQLIGELTPQGSKNLDTQRHGFRLNDIIVVESDCVHEILHHTPVQDYAVLCGPELPPGYDVADSRGVTQRNDVKVIVTSTAAPSDDWEEVWVHVSHVLPLGDVVHGIILDDPKRTARHGLQRYSKIDFARDCIVATRGGA